MEDRSHVVDDGCIREEFSDEQLLAPSILEVLWYADIVNLLVSGVYPPEATSQQKKKLYFDSRSCVWDKPYLFKQGVNRVIRRCVPECRAKQVLEGCHSSPYRGHHGGERIMYNVLQSKFFWPTLFKDVSAFVKECD